MDEQTLTFLLAGGHLNMEERRERGAWPHPPIPYSDVRAHLVRVIASREWFPCDLSEGREGVVIQNTVKAYICHTLQYSAWGVPIVSEKQKHVFQSPENAADFYLKWDMHLPGDRDGWKVVET